MIVIEHQQWFERRLTTRLPFRYGIAVMTQVPHVWLELTAIIDGARVTGYAADHLPPKWFTKNPDRSTSDEEEEMREVLRRASDHAAGGSAATIADLVEVVGERQGAWAREHRIPPLLAYFGVTFIERALLDAYCRRHDCRLADVLRDHAFGLRLGRVHESLAGSRARDWLPAAPLDAVICRHTVGLSDPLEDTEVDPGTAPQDGLPVSLAAAVSAYGLEHFKVKVTDGEAGLDRLTRVVQVLEQTTKGRFSMTLDGNETFGSAGALRTFFERARRLPQLASLWPRLLFVEQPFSRSLALSREIESELKEWREHPRLIIDESGAGPADVERALSMGYAGVSHKNCKGVLHGVANACLLAFLRRTRPEGRWIMSGEDLSNVGPIALPQDLAVQAALGNESVERNGHHYFAGLAGWPLPLQWEVRARLPDLYQPVEAGGFVRVRVASGRIATADCNRAAFGSTGFTMAAAGGACWYER